jgi:hypothetical protein
MKGYYMGNECPAEPNITNCGRAALDWLVDKQLMVIDVDFIKSDPANGVWANQLLVQRDALPAFTVLQPEGTSAKGTIDMADFSCKACIKRFQYVDAYGDETVEEITPPSGETAI